MWVATHHKKLLVGAFLGLLGALSLLPVVYFRGIDTGKLEGIVSYHQMCYNSTGGFVIIGEAIVLCGPGGKLSQKEQQQLDNKRNV